MAKTPKANPIVEPDSYNEVVARAVIAGIKLLDCQFHMKPQALDPRLQGKKYSIDVTQLEDHFDSQGRLNGVFRFAAICRSGRTTILKVVGEYLTSYRVSGECDEAAAKLFVERIGPFAAYPYFRALHGVLTSQAGINEPTLPILAEAPRRIARAQNSSIRTDSPLMNSEAD